MADTKKLRAWFLVHRWSSLICTLFLLLLCITGLPLIFHEDIEALSGDGALPALAAGTPPVNLDRLVEAARKERPGDAAMYMFWDPEERAKVGMSFGPTPTAETNIHIVNMDGRTGKVLHSENADSGFMYIMLRLHTDMFAGLPGMLFLGLMGILFLASIVSGVVLYAPFMRKLVFGTVRREKAPRLYWLDLHNLLGIATMTWLTVVGFTGVINSAGRLVVLAYQANEMADMTAPYKNAAPLRADELGSLQAAMETARRAIPGMEPSFVAFPGTFFSSQHHYAVFMAGNTPLTSRLLKPALIDAKTGELTAARDLPWYVKSLLISQPLHFGDYGGLPLKIAWALMDAAAIVVLGSGVYLWFSRRKRRLPFELVDADVDADADADGGANGRGAANAEQPAARGARPAAAAAAAARSVASRRMS